MICYKALLQIYCEAQAKHNIVGARTEKRRSEGQFAGLVVSGSGLVVVEEGGPPTSISLTSTLPVLCPPQDRVRGDCCVSLELSLTQLQGQERCPEGNILDRVGHY